MMYNKYWIYFESRCADGRIEGAIKKGKTWLIPADSKKPSDKRFKHHKSKKATSFLQNTSEETVL